MSKKRRIFRHRKHLGKLHPKVREWVLKERPWQEFWMPQRYAIERILEMRSQSDLLISAPTAGGKTMAVFLPLLSEVQSWRDKQAEAGHSVGGGGYELMYVSPLRALIQQQGGPTSDVSELCRHLGIGCTRWNSDVSHTTKARSWDHPEGVLMITPESLESRMLRRPHEIRGRFRPLRAVIIDELHAYFESPRGLQLISLLTRLEDALGDVLDGRSIPRIALSATLGEGTEESWKNVFRFLRPNTDSFELPEPSNQADMDRDEPGYEIDLNVLLQRSDDDPNAGVRAEIASKLRRYFDKDKFGHGEHTHWKTGIIFANSRREVERYTQLLNCEQNTVEVPPEWAEKGRKKSAPGNEEDLWANRRRYWPHHGSLESAHRSQAEKRMTSKMMPCTLVATTTLELGIDVGTIQEVAQIGAGFSVASLRQRMGRSGRPRYEERGGRYVLLESRPKLHIFLREPELVEKGFSFDALRLPTFQVVAQLRLLELRKFEEPDLERIHLSTFVQQLLSVIHQHRNSGISVEKLRALLVERGPFSALQQPLFERMQPVGENEPAPITIFEGVLQRLRMMHRPLIDLDVAEPNDEQEVFLTERGLQEVNSSRIYAAFKTAREYSVRSAAGPVGTIGMGDVYGTGDRILLAGRAWEITSISHRARSINVRLAPDGTPAYFTGDAQSPSAEVVRQMQELYTSEDDPKAGLRPEVTFSDKTKRMIVEARKMYLKQRIDEKRHVEHRDDVVLFPWVGSRALAAVAAALKWAGLPAAPFRVCVVVQNRTPEEVANGIDRLLKGGLPTPMELARRVGSVPIGKFGHFLSPSLLRRDLASSRFGDLVTLEKSLVELLKALRQERY